MRSIHAGHSTKVPRRDAGDGVVDEGCDTGLWFFSPELTPITCDPAVADRLPPDLFADFLVEQLHAHLSFTVQLETGLVAQGCRRLVESDTFRLTQRDRGAVEVVLEQEDKHAQWATELSERVSLATGTGPHGDGAEQLEQIHALIEAQSPDLRALLEILALFISETTITGVLRSLPGDQRVQRAVRDFARAHAHEERQHHILFRRLFLETWPTTDSSVRSVVGPLMVRILGIFLSIDRRHLDAMWARAACRIDTPATADAIGASRQVLASMHEAARPSLRMFEAGGVFDDPETMEALRHSGLCRPSARARAAS